MASREIEQMPAAELFQRWQTHIEKIKTETIYLFTTRHRWQEITQLFLNNHELNRIGGGDIYHYFLGLWGRDALMGVRRELDDQHGTINLRNLLYEMEARPETMARKRCCHVNPGQSELLQQELDRSFEDLGVVCPYPGNRQRADDHLPKDFFTRDRRQLQDNTKTAFDYAQRMVAHRTPVDELEIQVHEINAAVDAIEPVLIRYYALLVGPTLVGATAAIQWNWMEVFTIPWMPKATGES
jgi:hypothetical protein